MSDPEHEELEVVGRMREAAALLGGGSFVMVASGGVLHLFGIAGQPVRVATENVYRDAPERGRGHSALDAIEVQVATTARSHVQCWAPGERKPT